MKSIIFIDGENLRHKLAEVLIKNRRIKNGQELKKFDVRKFVEAIVPESTNHDIRYFGAKVKIMGKQKSTRQKTLSIIQQKRAWNSILKQQNISYVEAGALHLRTGSYPANSEYLIEKGVDVGMAVDMIVSVMKNNAKKVIFISSDADMLPVLRVLKGEKTEVMYIAHEGFILPSLSQFSDKTRTFTSSQIIKYFDSINKVVK